MHVILDRFEIIRSMLWYYLGIMLWHEEPITWQVCRRFIPYAISHLGYKQWMSDTFLVVAKYIS